MSEYMDIEAEVDDENGQMIHFFTNLPLTREDEAGETYQSQDELKTGSALAQALAVVEGILALDMEGNELSIVRDWDTPEHTLIAEVTAVIKDFFL